MRHIILWRSALAASLTALLAVGTSAVAQFGFHTDEEKIDISSYPADIQSGYKTFANKCSECHGLASSLKPSRSPESWTAEVHRMQAMASSHINDREADQILKFLRYDEVRRKASAHAAISTDAGRSPDAIGKQLFESYGCSSCHSVAGVGNTSSALDGVGSKRNAAELRKAVTSPASGSAMPPMDIPAKDLDNLVAYLLTLK